MQPSADDLMRPHSQPHRSLGELVEGLVVDHASSDNTWRDIPVTGMGIQTSLIKPGDIYVAVQGQRTHGARFAEQARARGAVAVLTDEAGVEICGQSPELKDFPVFAAKTGIDLRHTAGHMAARLYGNPGSELLLVGITGTNGKTTTTFFLDAILRAAGHKTGLMGTVEVRLAEQAVPSTRTTVEAPVLQGYLSRCMEEGVSAVSMEVSSHALSLGRVAGARFDVVGFTNLQRDHLDFHGTMTDYFRAKAQLFSAEYARIGVVNVDDEWGYELARTAEIDTWSLATTESRARETNATWRVAKVTPFIAGEGSEFVLAGPDGEELTGHTALPGIVNVANAALAALMARAANISPQVIVAGLKSLQAIPGRMEVVSRPDEPLTIVDYAHTTDALNFALSSMRQDLAHRDEPGESRLIVVFGAAGERDAGKRPDMGRVAVQHADIVLVADDDPYNESRPQIRRDILDGALPEVDRQREQGREVSIKNFERREDAIDEAISIASDRDIILIAGRGHERIQDLAGVQHELDDRVHARQALLRRSL
ncbi:UDP-N-acetylmuramoyl-L-alanyl-D-glutamate--2,6-diaminopimelate ligase [Jonesia quinghaiensis]|uniref:UDP-N-acetylmuramoyl-L-alanyl-D-glutamate--2, 6-diaminopimelate ligase n=1 Tax=Jonesia quinghaiensis TaxID=262806 RepID=UPI00040996CF|nr:UDP-N-acetylmuramoyl-L-alanyl-D-glutamate--2,6-diaminopimelate ligase [Jonesia quinghaiensis]